MRFSNLIVLVSTSGAVARRCGTEDVPADVLRGLARLQDVDRNLLKNRDTTVHLENNQHLTIPLYFHTVSAPGKENEITDESLAAQYKVLADTYADYGIRFDYHGVATRTVDQYFSTFPYPINREQRLQFNTWRKSTRQGGYDALNLYFYTDMTDGFWGSCNLLRAWNNTDATGVNTFYEDACNIHGSTVPGGAAEGLNLGYTAVHEIGHWLGLLHVFMGYTCGMNGDMIDDTPEQSTNTEGCPVGKDSCPDFPGLDSIHNFMDYSGDDCYTEFTPGQQVRMHSSFEQFRASPPSPPEE